MSAAVVAQWVGIGIGLLGAAAAWWRSGQANREAGKANELAGTANGIAGAANQLSEEAVEAARKSNAIAGEANDLSQQANEVAQASYERQAEDHHVRWEGEWVEPGVYRLFNRGHHTAYAVSLDIRVGQRLGRMTEDAVHKDAYIDIDATPEALAVIRELAERAEQKQAREQRASTDQFGLASVSQFEPRRMPNGHLHYDITWTSELGQRHTDAHTSRFIDYGVQS